MGDGFIYMGLGCTGVNATVTEEFITRKLNIFLKSEDS